MNIVFWGEARQSGTTANLTATAAVLSELCPQKKIVIRRRMKTVKDEAGYIFFDCGTGLTEHSRQLLWQADAVVMNVRQDQVSDGRFLGSHLHLARDPYVLLGSCFGDAEAGRMYLERVHRILPEQAGAISYNSEFHQAMLCGKGITYVRHEYRSPANAKNEQFIGEVERIARFILRKEAQLGGLCGREPEYLIREQPSTFHKARRK